MRCTTILLLICGFLTLPAAPAQEIAETFFGEGDDDQFGRALSSAGDVDSDGFPDLLVGAPFQDTVGLWSGSVRVVSGRDGTLLFHLGGENELDYFGCSVARAGDLDGDGQGEILIGAHGSDRNGKDSGSVYAFSGMTGTRLFLLHGEAPSSRFGRALAGAGDLDGDGVPDFVVGSHEHDGAGEDSGRVYVYSGGTGSLRFSWSGATAFDSFGWSLGGSLDADGDGVPDVVVGSFRDDALATNGGGVFLYSGNNGALLREFHGAADFDHLGYSVAMAPDMDGDACAEILAGAPNADAAGGEEGRVFVYSGRTGALLYQYQGDSAGDIFGTAVSGCEDLDRDAAGDFIVGAPYADHSGTNAGTVFVYSGATGSLLYSTSGRMPGDHLGEALAGIGDLNLDGAAEFAAGAPFNDDFGYDAGVVYLYQASGPWRDLGFAKEGSSGAPSLKGFGSLEPSSTFSLNLSSAAPGSIAYFIIGAQVLYLPFRDGTFVPSPQLMIGLFTSPSGTVQLNSQWSKKDFSGLSLYYQCWILDAGASFSMSASNALQSITP